MTLALIRRLLVKFQCKIWEEKKKVCTHFVHALSDNQKFAGVEYAKDILKIAETMENLLQCILTGNESFCYDPETKCHSAEWKLSQSPKGKKGQATEVQNQDNACVLFRTPREFCIMSSVLKVELSLAMFVCPFWNNRGRGLFMPGLRTKLDCGSYCMIMHLHTNQQLYSNF